MHFSSTLNVWEQWNNRSAGKRRARCSEVLISIDRFVNRDRVTGGSRDELINARSPARAARRRMGDRGIALEDGEGR